MAEATLSQPKLPIGAPAPDFELPDVSGAPLALSSLAGAPVVVVVFSCNHCPYVQAYEGRMIDFQRRYAARGVRMVLINANDAATYPEDSSTEMRARAERLAYPFPYLRDETQDVARAYRAAHTPEFYVFDQARLLAYHGRFDDNLKEPARVATRHLENAVEDLLAGRVVGEPETFAIGCTIKWKDPLGK